MTVAWPSMRLEELCDVTSSKRIYAKELVQSGVPFLKSKEIIEKVNGQDHSNLLYISEERFQEILDQTGAPIAGDVLLTSRGTLGVPYVVKSTDRFHFADGNLTWFKNFRDLESRYLSYFFLSPSGKAELKKCVIGSSQAAYTIASLKRVEIALPPHRVQRRIADILSNYDELIGINRRRMEILEEIAGQTYESWFVRHRYPGHATGRLSPTDWEQIAIEDACERIQAGGTPSRKASEYWTGEGTDWYTTGELKDNFLFGSAEKVSRKAVNEKKARIFPAGTFLMAIYGSPTVGRLGILTNDSSCNQAALGVIPNKSKVGYWYLFFKLKELRQHFNSLAQGAAQQNISKIKVATTSIDVPPSELVDQFESFAAPIMSQIKILTDQCRNLRLQRDTLLPKLLSGQIDVTGMFPTTKDAVA